jgi:hypothetical protein
MGTPMTYISGNTGTYQSGTFNKGTIALNLNPTSLGSGNNWYNGVDVTATQYLIYSDTYSQGQATQANSKPTAWTTPDLNDSSLLALINTLPDRVGLTSFTSLPLALQWLNATNKYFLIKTNFENIVTSGLVLNLDAGWYNSYSGTTTWFDRSGSGNHVTLRNGPTFDSSSQGSISFDGTDDYAGNDSPTLPTGNVTITICAWINVQTTSNTWQGIVGWGNRTTSQSALLDMNNGRLAFSTWGGVGSEDLISTYNVPLKTWKFIVGSINNKNIKLYADGIKVLDASITSTPNVASTALRIATTDYPGRLLNTKVASVQIYNKELTDQEILQNYNAQKSRFGIYDIVQSGLTINYDASNYLSYPRSGTTWFNMTSNPANGSLINGPTFNTGTTPSIQFDGSDDTLRADYNLSQFNTITINFLANSTYSNESMVWSLGSGGPDWYTKDDTMGYNSYAGDTYGLSTTQINQLGLRNNWHMLTMTYTQNGAIANNKVYVDGIQQTISQQLSTTSTKTFSNTGINFLSAFNNNGYNVNANVGHISVYNRELSSQEIVQNFESLRKQYPITGYTTNGLVLNLDAGNYASYPTTGTKWVDTSGNYNNGTLTNGPVWSNTSGGTITLDGVDDYVVKSNVTGLSNLEGNFTIEAFIRPTSANYGNIVVLANSNYDLECQVVYLTNYILVTKYGGTALVTSSANSVPLNTWNHVVYRQENNTGSIFINGQLNASTSIVPQIAATTNFLLGVYNTTAPQPFGGNYSAVRVYNRALSASEVLQNYNALKGRFGL